MSFNSQFKLIFGETFQTEGFRYCSKLNVFVKMLNEDLMAFFGVKTAPEGEIGSTNAYDMNGIRPAFCVDGKQEIYKEEGRYILK